MTTVFFSRFEDRGWCEATARMVIVFRWFWKIGRS